MELREGERAKDRFTKGQPVRVMDPVRGHMREGVVSGFSRDGRGVWVRFTGLKTATRFAAVFVGAAP